MTEADASFEGPGKGKSFFDRAKTVAATGNYEYAIDMYKEGLNREPFNLAEFQELYKLGMARKFKGGKAAGGMMGPKPPFKGKTAKDQLLNGAWLMAHDPGERTALQLMLRNAVALNYTDVVYWVAQLLMNANATNKAPKKEFALDVVDAYEKLSDYQKAADAMAEAIKLAPNDMELLTRIKNLSAQAVMKKGYENKADFKDSLASQEKTKELLQQDALQKSEEFRNKLVKDAAEQYQKDPMNHQTISKYSKALMDMDDEEYENKAIEVLKAAHKATKIYQYKMTIGDIRIKQIRRNIRLLKEVYEQDKTDKEMEKSLHEQQRALLAFELEEFKERAENFPTDLAMQFMYGERLYLAKRYDDAIPIFQLTQNNPRLRSDTLHLLGRSFMDSGMKPEAVETLRRGIESYELAETGDKKSLEYFYWLARALEETNEKSEAQKIYSKVMQWNFSYRDVRERLKKLRDEAAANVPAEDQQ